MAAFAETLSRLALLPDFEAERPATDEEVTRIETDLRVKLPSQYVTFLKTYGSASWFGKTILGIRPISRLTGEPSTVTPDCISKTKRERADRMGTQCLPPNHVVIATDGGGGNFVLFGTGSTSEGEIHWYNFEDGPDPINVWPDLNRYLEHEIGKAYER